MNLLKKFTYSSINKKKSYLLMCNNFNYKIFKNINNFFLVRNTKMYFDTYKIKKINILNTYKLEIKKNFFYKKKFIFHVKNFILFKFLQQMYQKLFLIYFRKEKKKFFYGFLGVISNLPYQKNLKKKIYI